MLDILKTSQNLKKRKDNHQIATVPEIQVTKKKKKKKVVKK